MRIAPSTRQGELLRHPEVLKGVGERAGEPGHVPGEISTPRNLGIDGIRGCFTLLLREDGLLLEERGEELVRVLHGAERQNVGCIDLVEHGDFRVQIGVTGKGVFLEVRNPALDRLGIPADGPDGGQRRGVCSVSEFDRGILGFDTPMVASAVVFAPSASSTEAYWDLTRSRSAGVMLPSAVGS